MLNEALRLVRVFHDLNKTQVAERVGLSKSYITELERGDKKVTIEVLQKYADGFNIPVSSLMFFAEQADGAPAADRVRTAVAGKVVKMLDWIATVTADDPDEGDRHGEKVRQAR
ncbi:helix-turn-helix domain-containing protein [Sphingomonas nostoxanthinifaciens]|uniref:helix-turn-helix domain-containing protein n=1 Tax=Sphingomonas nostoxanthinifaciens TaxID=2872652 RepID=UPI001CC20822|nr:helix-turn-helix transcriptional regulator [Sphingomonas nostoxanthinifaciens]UAK23843.1 helix-turn-helix domain-containing protein [Sphingomonas nostoxanthinifaciens]